MKTRLAITRTGTGEPLVLLHPLGLSSHVWEPVVPALALRFEVVTVDLPGHGRSPVLPRSVEPSPAALAAAVADALDDAGVQRPHVVGNSLGGWTALELAHLRPLATLTLLSPAGMWPGDAPLYCRVSLAGTRWATEHLTGLLHRMVGTRVGRTLVLGQSHGRPWRVTPDQARTSITELGTSAGFPGAFRATHRRRYRASDGAGMPPVTVAFGDRDRVLLLPSWRRTDELPDDVVVGTLPGCGHVPMYDDPAAVVALVTASTAARSPR